MYHARVKGLHYEIGYKWGATLKKNGQSIIENIPFCIDQERIDFAKECLPIYQRLFPECVEEIKGIAKGQEIDVEQLYAILFSMYCIMPKNHCSCFAFKNKDSIILGRNSDFVCSIEKYCMHCMYQLSSNYSFSANTTAFVQMEDGVNTCGLAIGLTSVYPKIIKPGLNAGFLLRYGFN